MPDRTDHQPGSFGITSLVGAGLSLMLRSRAGLLSDRTHWQRRTAGIQLDILRNLLRAASGTEFGRAHDFARIGAIDDPLEMLRAYRAGVPIRDYEGFRADCARMREGGKRDVLWPGLVEDFAQTSGTTSGDKFMPVSRQMLKSNYRASLDIFANMMRRGLSVSRLMGGKCLFLGGCSDLVENEHGVRTGDLSGIVTPLIRWPISQIYSPGPEIALMDDWPRKIEAMARVSKAQDVRMISGMPSWALVLFKELMAQTGAGTVRDIWPNLTVFVHGGVRYQPFLPRVAQAYSGDEATDLPARLELYPASEAFVAIQDEPGEESLRLCADHANFFEFVPMDEIDNEHPRACACWEVEPGERYVVTLSTCAGLWRYVLGDVVVFDEVPAGPDGRGGTGPARLRIVGRHKHFINAFGENIIVEHIERAVEHAAGVAGLAVGEFTAAPVYPGPGRKAGLELIVEIQGEAGDRFAAAFDDSLKRQNVDYTTKRGDGLGMGPPTITPVPMGTFHRWLEGKGKLGGQRKCPRCANHREIADEVRASAPR